MAPLPKGEPDGKNVAALGGQLLAVSKYSKNVDVASDLDVSYRAGENGRSWVRSTPRSRLCFKDPAIQQAAPFIGELFGLHQCGGQR